MNKRVEEALSYGPTSDALNMLDYVQGLKDIDDNKRAGLISALAGSMYLDNVRNFKALEEYEKERRALINMLPMYDLNENGNGLTLRQRLEGLRSLERQAYESPKPKSKGKTRHFLDLFR